MGPRLRAWKLGLQILANEMGKPISVCSASPLLANVYLHYVFELWVQRWRRTQARGEVIVVRYADDCAPRHP